MAAPLARALRELGREAEARNALDAALRTRPSDPVLAAELTRLIRHRWAPVKQGLALLHSDEPTKAKEVFATALKDLGKRCPLEALFDILCGIGWCDQKLGLAATSLSFFERAARLKPDRLDAAYGAGLALRLMGNEHAARLRLARAATIEKAAAGPIAFIGWCHHEAGRQAPAQRAFEAALKRNSRDTESTWGLAWALWSVGDVAGAADRFLAALKTGLHHSVADLIAIIPDNEGLKGVADPLALKLLDHGRAAEAHGLTLNSDTTIRVLIACGRDREALAHDGVSSTRSAPTLKDLVQAALRSSFTEQALAFAERLREPDRTRAVARIHEASGAARKALEIRLSERAELLPETESEIERLQRTLQRKSLSLLGTATLPEDGPTRQVAVRHRARQLAEQGKLSDISALLENSEENKELLEELMPTATARTPRGYLSAVLSGLKMEEPPPSGLLGLAAKLLLSDTPPTHRSLRRLARLLSQTGEDTLLANALRRLIQRENTK